MKRKYILIFAVAVLLIGLFAGCKDEADETATQDSLFEEVSSEYDIIQDKEISTGTEEISEENGTQQAETSYEMPDWQTAYAEYIEGVDYTHYNKYALIYVDEDDIPELVIYTGTYATACLILTFHNGEVDALQTGSLQCNYLEKENLLLDAGGQMGEFFDHIYSIENDKWVYVTGGEYIAKFDENGWIPDEYDYEWDGEAVMEDVYYEKLGEIWDWEQNQNVPMEQYDTLEEMLLRLQM